METIEFPVADRITSSVEKIHEEINIMRNMIEQKTNDNTQMLNQIGSNIDHINSLRQKIDLALFEVRHLMTLKDALDY